MTIFISYSSSDRPFANKLAANLVAKRARVWMDHWELRVGDSLVEKIQSAIQDSDGLILVLSKASVASDWCGKEFNAGLLRELEERRVIVMPALIEDCDIPIFIRGKLYADFRTSFDEGLAKIIEAAARVSSEAQGRIERERDWHTDWSIDTPIIDRQISMLITLVEHGELYPYCVLSQLWIFPDSPAAESLWWKCVESDLTWMLKGKIVAELGQMGEERANLHAQLSGPEEQVVRFSVREGTHQGYKVRVSSRWLGQDTGGDVLVDIGGQLKIIRASWTRAVRQPSSDERTKFEAIWS